MARNDIWDILPSNTVIHCKNQEEDARVRAILQSYNFKWAAGDAMSYSFWDEYKEEFCINPFDCLYASKTYYEKEGKKVISTDEFLKHIN